MKDICLTYVDSDIRPAKYLISFFRVIGIYVYERIILGSNNEKTKFPQIDLDINIVILGSDMAKELIEQYGTENTFFILMRDGKVLDDNYVVIGKDKTNNDILTCLLDVLSNKYLQFSSEKKNILKMAKIFENNKLAETILGTRYFPPDENIYDKLCLNYEKAINEISDYILEDKKENIKGNFLWFAMAYLGYEYNYCRKRLKLGFLYRPDNLLEIVDELQEGYNGRWSSLFLLKAQIYGDLKEKARKAYEIYDEATPGEYNAFAWYKMGSIWQQLYKDEIIAARHFKQAMRINPSYYRAVYKTAECYHMLRRFRESETLYKRVIILLTNNYNKGILSPMDIEYLYKANINIAKIEATQYGDIFEAIRIYNALELLWRQIINDSDEEDICSSYISISELDSNILTELYQELKNKLEVKDIIKERYLLENMISVND